MGQQPLSVGRNTQITQYGVQHQQPSAQQGLAVGKNNFTSPQQLTLQHALNPALVPDLNIKHEDIKKLMQKNITFKDPMGGGSGDIFKAALMAAFVTFSNIFYYAWGKSLAHWNHQEEVDNAVKDFEKEFVAKMNVPNTITEEDKKNYALLIGARAKCEGLNSETKQALDRALTDEPNIKNYLDDIKRIAPDKLKTSIACSFLFAFISIPLGIAGVLFVIGLFV